MLRNVELRITLLLRALIWLVVVGFVGCGSSDVAPTNGQTLIVAESIELDGRIWYPGEVTRATGDVSRPSMVARVYHGERPDERLLEFNLKPDSEEPSDGVFKRMLYLQVKRNGRWISHSRVAEWMLDGSRSDSEYFEGEIHGTQREWYSNGQLHIERQWVNGKMHGRDRAWYPNGKPQYDVSSVNGMEISGQVWDENGKPLKP